MLLEQLLHLEVVLSINTKGTELQDCGMVSRAELSYYNLREILIISNINTKLWNPLINSIR